MKANKPSPKTRRSFLKNLAVSSGALLSAPAIITAKDGKTLFRPYENKTFSPNDTIQIAIIGNGGMGKADSSTALKIPGVKMVAACDCYLGNQRWAQNEWGKDIFVTDDYKEILARPDIDAVIVATPDHWHKQISVDALHAGKAVYCEKPMVHSIDEGSAVVKAQKESGNVFQVGSQGMSSLGNEKGRALFEAGAIGQLTYAEGFWARNSPGGAWQYGIPENAEAECNWEQFLGTAPKRPFDPVRYFRWRNYVDYGTGVAGDLFVHLFSSLHYVINSKGPEKVMATGGLRFWKDGREVPDVLLGMFDYPETDTHPAFNLMLRVNFTDGTSGSNFLRLVGTEGAMDVDWEKVVLYQTRSWDPVGVFKNDDAEEIARYGGRRSMMLPAPKAEFTVENGYKGAHYDHHYNFYKAIREGNTVIEDAVFGYRAAAPALLCNDSYFQNKIMYWNPESMTLKG